MNHNSSTRFASILAAVILAFMGSSRPAVADIIGFWFSHKDFYYNVSNMPDIDQRRADVFVNNVFIPGLPNSGAMYCVPTSSMDLLAYIASHGYPGVFPGVADWSVSPPDPGYAFTSTQLANLGACMQTDPKKGTGFDTAQACDQVLLDSAAPGDFAVSWDGASGSYCPLQSDIAEIAIFGSLVEVGVGWYTQKLPGPDHWFRAGGHALALTRADSLGYIGFSDPASDEQPNHIYWKQSPFSQDVYEVHDVTSTFGAGDPYDLNSYFLRTETQIGNGSGYLDGYLSITPKFALAWDGVTLVAIYPKGFVPDVPQQLTYPPIAGKKVIDVVINPVRTLHPYIVEDSNAIWQIQLLDGTSSRFAEVDHPRRIVQGGRDLNLYVVCPEHLVCFDRSGKRGAQVHLNDPLAAVAYDDFRNHVIGVSAKTNMLYVFDPTDLHMISSFPLPEGATGHGERVTLSTNPVNGVLYVHTDGSTMVTVLAFREVGGLFSGQVALGGTERPTGFFVDERGMFFVTDGGLIKSFFPSGMPAEHNRFAGFTGGKMFQILRPHSNFDPATMNSPSFFNVLPEDAPR